MRLIDFNIINLSSDPRSLANFESMVQIARYDVQMCLIDMIRPCVLDIARDKNGLFPFTCHITKPVFIFFHFLFIISSSTFFICLGTMLCKVWSFFTMELPTFLSIQWQTTLPACHIIHMLALLSKSVCTLAARGMSSSSSLSSQPLAALWELCLAIGCEKALCFECWAVQGTHFWDIEQEKRVRDSWLGQKGCQDMRLCSKEDVSLEESTYMYKDLYIFLLCCYLTSLPKSCLSRCLYLLLRMRGLVVEFDCGGSLCTKRYILLLCCYLL